MNVKGLKMELVPVPANFERHGEDWYAANACSTVARSRTDNSLRTTRMNSDTPRQPHQLNIPRLRELHNVPTLEVTHHIKPGSPRE